MATKIDAQFMKSVLDYNVKEKLRSETAGTSAALVALFNGVYDAMFVFACENDCAVTCLADMEARLGTEEKKDWFRKAQGYQLIYELENGKNSLVTPADFNLSAKHWDWCADTVRIMRQVLGFNRPTLFTRR